eukprot:366121-Chlamydomonas_euryale.AAC.9
MDQPNGGRGNFPRSTAQNGLNSKRGKGGKSRGSGRACMHECAHAGAAADLHPPALADYDAPANARLRPDDTADDDTRCRA